MNGNLFQSMLPLLLASISGTISPYLFHSSRRLYKFDTRSHSHKLTSCCCCCCESYCSNQLSAFRGYWLRLLYNHMQHFLRLASLLLLLPEVASVVAVVVVVVATSCNQSSAFLGEAST